MKIRTEQVLDVCEWDRLVMKTYGRPYSFQQQDDCKARGTEHIDVSDGDYFEDYENDTVPEEVNHPEMGVSFAAWITRDPAQPLSDGRDDYGLDMWWERNFYPHVDAVSNDLCKKGLLAAGRYTINIDW